MPGARPARADTCAKVLYLHIGTSRTATTTLQQHVLSHLRGVSQFTKKPGQGMKISRAGGRNLLALLDRQAQFMSQLKTQEPSNVLMQIRFLAYNASIRSATHKQKAYKALIQYLDGFSKVYSGPVFISCEGLAESNSALNGEDSCYLDCPPFVTLLRAIGELGRHEPRIVACFRDPIPLLASRYARCLRQRAIKQMLHLNIKTYIQNQVTLDRHAPYLSALASAVHARYLQFLESECPVTAFGFQQLIRSKDIFDLMRVPFQEKLSLESLPLENHSVLDKPTKNYVEDRIRDSLGGHGYLSLIKRSQLFM